MTTTHARVISLVEGGRRLGYKSTSHVYRLLDKDSAWYDQELHAIVHTRPNGRRYFVEDELDTLVRSRCSTVAPAQESAA
jgi:hypothetical protein